MATKVALSFVAFVVVAAMWEGAMAQSGCTNVLISMSPCLNYINGNSATPSSQCCTQLASVVRSSPECLCQVLNGGGSTTGVNVNRTRALELPASCNVQTPPISRCNAAGSPAASPSGTPEKAVPSTPSGAGAPSGTGSKNVPSTEDGTSAGSSINLSISLLFFLLVAASYGSIFSLA